MGERLQKKPLEEFLRELSHGITPGGGSAAALAASMAAALGVMVADLTVGKEIPADKRDRMKKLMVEVEGFRDALLAMVEEDSLGYQALLAAFRLPKETQEQRKRRHEDIQKGYRKALETPLKVAELCIRLLALSGELAKEGYSQAVTDAGVMALMADAALQGSILNILVNMKGIKDNDEVSESRSRAERMKKEGNILKQNALSEVFSRL